MLVRKIFAEKLLWLTWLLCLFVYHAVGQNRLPPQPFYLFTPDVLFRLKVNLDTIDITQCSYDLNCRGSSKYQYKIVGQQQRDSFLLLYVRTLVHLSSDHSNRNEYQVLIVNYSNDWRVLHFMNELNFYSSAEQAKDSSQFDPSTKFTWTYFDEEQLSRFRSWKKITDLDSTQAVALCGAMKQEAFLSQDKIQRTRAGDIYGTVIVKELENRALIRFQINPAITQREISSALLKYCRE